MSIKNKGVFWLLLAVMIAALSLAGCGGGGGGGGTSGGTSGGGTSSTAPKSISWYSLGGVTGTINSSNHTIAVTVPYGTTVTALVANFTYSGASITVGGTNQVSGLTANDFTNPVIYTVTATDGTSVNYTVTVTVAPSSAKAITAFSLSGGWTGAINEAAKTISVSMPSSASVTALVATFTTTGQSVTVNGVNQVSGTTTNNFTSPVTYTVTAADGTTTSYTVTVTLIPPVTVGGTLNGLASGSTIGLADNGTDLLSLTANGAFTFSQTVSYGSPYSVTIPTLPTGQPCTSTYNAGTVATAAIANVNVICGPTAVGSFNATGSQIQALGDGDATLLPNGKVLLTGGDDGQSVDYASAELYDPVAGTWSSAASMSGARMGHTATLLPNGKVLIAGGRDINTVPVTFLASAELYDPATNSWSATGSMTIPRDTATATLLPNGKVLVAGGNSYSGSITSTAELYDPATGTWTATANSMTVGRTKGTATLLPNGKVLLSGGESFTASLTLAYNASAELYDPAADTFTATGSMATGRAYDTATLMPNGKVLVTGGLGGASGVMLSSAEVYDPALGTWAGAGSMSATRWQHTATLLPTGKVMVVAGQGNSGGGTTQLATAELYDPAANTWTATGSMTTGRQNQTATLLANGKLLVCGGFDSFLVALASCQLYW